ncbi:MAG TPA: MinD/ParA family protein [Armatimonadota bacterium]|nr:MinD/ParA family protein [Armatimonadota bacterium]
MTDQAENLRTLVTGSVATDDLAWACVNTRVIAVTSGKGGVGKTMLTVNLALLIAEMGKRVLIVDADLGLANVDVMMGLPSGRHVGHLMLADFSADDVAGKGPHGIRVVSGGSGLQELADISGEDRQLLIKKLSAYYRQFDYVLLDTSPGIGSDVVDFLSHADEVLVVTTPEPTSLRDTYASLKTLVAETPAAEPKVIVNMAVSKEQAKQAMAVVNEVSTRFLGRAFKNWHHIESDPLVVRTIQDRRPLVVSFPRSPAAACMRRLAKCVSEEVHALVQAV